MFATVEYVKILKFNILKKTILSIFLVNKKLFFNITYKTGFIIIDIYNKLVNKD